MAKVRLNSGVFSDAEIYGKSGQIYGIPELIRKLNQLPAKTGGKILRESVRYAATPIRALAKLKIPKGSEAHRTYKGNLVSPGFAKRSIKMASKIRRDGVIDLVIGVKAEAFYATQFVELGTTKMRAQEWLVPAFEEKQSDFEKRLESKLREKILSAIK